MSIRGIGGFERDLPASFIEYEMKGIISHRDAFKRGIREGDVILIIAEEKGRIIGFA